MSLGQSLNSTHLFRDIQAALSLAAEVDTKCAICQDDIANQQIACSSGHSFCTECLFVYRTSFERSKSEHANASNPLCPQCRVEMLDHDKQVPDLGKRLACTLPAVLEAALLEVESLKHRLQQRVTAAARMTSAISTLRAAVDSFEKLPLVEDDANEEALQKEQTKKAKTSAHKRHRSRNGDKAREYRAYTGLRTPHKPSDMSDELMDQLLEEARAQVGPDAVRQYHEKVALELLQANQQQQQAQEAERQQAEQKKREEQEQQERSDARKRQREELERVQTQRAVQRARVEYLQSVSERRAQQDRPDQDPESIAEDAALARRLQEEYNAGAGRRWAILEDDEEEEEE